MAYLYLFAAWGITLWFLSAGNPAPKGGPEIPHLDKAAHVILFMVFTIIYIRDRLKFNGLKTIPSKYFFWAFLVILPFAILVEILQEILNLGRDGDFMDVLYDIAGFLLGSVILWFMRSVLLRGL